MTEQKTRATTGLDAYDGLRVTDVCDGMDALGMQDIGLMSRDIRPLWRDTENFTHRIYGRAHTIRFVPTQRKIEKYTPDEFYTWMADWYKNIANGPKPAGIKKGEIVVIDGFEIGSVGPAGSMNSLAWVVNGAAGVVTNGGARDTDELIKQKIPVYSRYISRTIRPGRVEFDAENVTVNCGGATVRPGDIIVADGDGVVVVPQEISDEVAHHAWRHADKDKDSRRKLYKEAGLPEDWTVA